MTYRLYNHDTSPALNTRIINSNIYRKNYWIINYTARTETTCDRNYSVWQKIDIQFGQNLDFRIKSNRRKFPIAIAFTNL